MRNVELLVPAKDYATAVDAIDCGADAVYIGAGKFGARHAATNTVEDIARVASYAHRYGVKVYVTLNTILYDEELDEARQQAIKLAEAGADAFIVQDMAYCRMGLPVPLHASTQTSCTSPEKVEFFERVGFERVVLERNLSLEDIRAIRRYTSVELETFVHGAICVGYSGRCFLSRSTSERSGNRGCCSQPCRLEYDLCNGQGEAIIRRKHLLSVRDLDLSARLGELIDAGVVSFKIEGRLKDRAYVRNIVTLYRRALDREIAGRSDVRRASVGRSAVEFEPNAMRTFTRGASEYFFDGKCRGVASFDTPKAMGERVGVVARVERRGVVLDGDHDLATGDGVCFVAAGSLVGTNVVGVNGREVQLNGYEGIARGVEIYRNFNRRFTAAVEHSRVRRTISADFTLQFEADRITLSAVDDEGVEATAIVECVTEEVRDRARGEEALRRQLARSGDTMFEVRSVAIENLRFVPISVVGALRREVLQRLEERRVEAHGRSVPFVECLDARYPFEELAPQDNVTNRLAEEFYRDHGVRHIELGLDCRTSTTGEYVMQTSYCLRREIGECLKEKPRLKGDLFLVRGAKRYRLCFDCKACQMRLIDD